MARIRSIKPGFFGSEDVTALTFRARLTWIGLWTYCDDHGRGKDNTKLIKAAVWPLDEVSLQDVDDDLAELARHKRIVRYRDGAQRLLAVTTWHFHQSVNRPGKTTIPAPPRGSVTVPEPGESGHCRLCFREVDTPGGLSEDSCTSPGNENSVSPGQPPQGSLRERNMQSTEDSRTTHGGLTPGKERNGTETDTPSFGGGVSVDHLQTAQARDSERSLSHTRTPPARRGVRCAEHQHDTNPPRCGACAHARREAEQAEHEQRSAARHAELRSKTGNRRRAIENCRMCDDNGYLGTAVCNHDPDAEDRATRGRALINGLMGWTSPDQNTAEGTPR